MYYFYILLCLNKQIGVSNLFKKFLNYIFKTKLVRSTLRTVAVKLLYSPTRFVQLDFIREFNKLTPNARICKP